MGACNEHGNIYGFSFKTKVVWGDLIIQETWGHDTFYASLHHFLSCFCQVITSFLCPRTLAPLSISRSYLTAGYLCLAAAAPDEMLLGLIRWDGAGSSGVMCVHLEHTEPSSPCGCVNFAYAWITSCCLDERQRAAGHCEPKFIISPLLTENK